MAEATSADKKVLGTAENVERNQIYSAITDYCMMAIVQKMIVIERPLYEMLQHVSILLTGTMPVTKLFVKPIYNIVNDLDGSTEPTLS